MGNWLYNLEHDRFWVWCFCVCSVLSCKPSRSYTMHTKKTSIISLAKEARNTQSRLNSTPSCFWLWILNVAWSENESLKTEFYRNRILFSISRLAEQNLTKALLLESVNYYLILWQKRKKELDFELPHSEGLSPLHSPEKPDMARGSRPQHQVVGVGHPPGTHDQLRGNHWAEDLNGHRRTLKKKKKKKKKKSFRNEKQNIYWLSIIPFGAR